VNNHKTEVQWTYTVPPHNDARVLITQRQDSPFSRHVVGGKGHYYTSVELLIRGQWAHSEGSASGGHRTFEEAYEQAESQWTDLLHNR
jgi:hypothetical protein